MRPSRPCGMRFSPTPLRLDDVNAKKAACGCERLHFSIRGNWPTAGSRASSKCYIFPAHDPWNFCKSSSSIEQLVEREYPDRISRCEASGATVLNCSARSASPPSLSLFVSGCFATFLCQQKGHPSGGLFAFPGWCGVRAGEGSWLQNWHARPAWPAVRPDWGGRRASPARESESPASPGRSPRTRRPG